MARLQPNLVWLLYVDGVNASCKDIDLASVFDGSFLSIFWRGQFCVKNHKNLKLWVPSFTDNFWTEIRCGLRSNFTIVRPECYWFQLTIDMTYYCISSHNLTRICKLGQKWDSKKWGFYGILWVPLEIQNFWKGSSAVPWVVVDVLDLVSAHKKLLRFGNLSKNGKKVMFWHFEAVLKI